MQMNLLRTIACCLAMILFCATHGFSQKLMGLVVQKNSQGIDEPVPGANVYWLGTTTATQSGSNGVFMINRTPGKHTLVVSFAGMRTDTLYISDERSVKVNLYPEQLHAVTIEGWKPATGLDHTRGVNTSIMGEKELFKAACCNLSESFETNPSVDVAFTDALTGTRQIQMLGLAGPNTFISIENMPGVRGLASSQGIQFIPGTWINSIEVTKGVGPVVNGYESIAGQINVELKKPQESEKLYVNGYLNQSGRSEMNVNYTGMAGNKWATTALLHGSTRPFEMDGNSDGFLDFPLGSQINFINRWVFSSGNGWLGQFGIKMLRDTKQGGQKGFDPEQDRFTINRYGLEINTNRKEVWGKLGYQFPDRPYKSVGLQLSGTEHHHESYFGFTIHDGSQTSGYANLIYQSIIGTTQHKFKTGFSFMYDVFDERLSNAMNPIVVREGNEMRAMNGIDFRRRESVPGAFFEYTYTYPEKVTIIAGLRVDEHNLFGTIVTPRLHTLFSLTSTSSLRLSAGRGTRMANIISENTGVLASSRQIVFSNLQSKNAYGFKPDQAWNYGLNFSQDFNLNYRPGAITFDYFFTDFENQVVVDLDRSAREVNFFGLRGRSYSHSLQLQADYELMRRLDLRVAYRWLDAKTDYLDGRLARPMIPQHRAFMNLAYETRSRWKFDYTIQWLGEQRMPNTSLNPHGYHLDDRAPSYFLMNGQISKDFSDKWSVYLGMENIGNFSLDNPIVAADDPFSPYFDSSMAWGPIFGRLTYAGFRYRLK